MHHCLKVVELLRTIFRFVQQDDVTGEPTLYALALTCKIFRDLANECLWESLPSMEPLLHCFPPDLCSYYDGTLVSSAIIGKAC